MLIHLMHFVVMWLNNFPVSNEISSTYSPRKIVLRHYLDCNHHCLAPFGAYCKTHKDNTPTNNMTTRGCPAICLGPMGNIQGTYNFLSLVTGMVIKHHRFDELPIPDVVIKHAEHLAGKSGVSRDLVFANHNQVSFNWPDKAFTKLDDTPMAFYPDIPANMPGLQLDRDPNHDTPMAIYPDIPTDMPGVQLARDPTHQQHSTPSTDTDWSQMGDKAMVNADFQDSDILSPAPEVIVINDDDDTPLLLALKHKSTPAKVKPDTIVPPVPTLPKTRRYLARDRAPPTCLDDYLLFTTVAEDTQTSYPYLNAGGQEVDLAIQDEVMMAHICHYVMLHTAESQFVGNPNNKKQYRLKAGLRKFQ